MDDVDIANDYAERMIAESIAARTRYEGVSAHECAECGDEIPEARRQAVPGCTLCVACARRQEVRR